MDFYVRLSNIEWMYPDAHLGLERSLDHLSETEDWEYEIDPEEDYIRIESVEEISPLLKNLLHHWNELVPIYKDEDFEEPYDLDEL